MRGLTFGRRATATRSVATADVAARRTGFDALIARGLLPVTFDFPAVALVTGRPLGTPPSGPWGCG